jgi:hypothetical protein
MAVLTHKPTEAERAAWYLLRGRQLGAKFRRQCRIEMEANLATSGKSLQVQSLEPLFQLTLPRTNAPLFDVTRDGSRFLVATSADPNASQSITLLHNWEAELKSK